MTLLEFIVWKYNGTSEENIKNITKSDSNFAPNFVNHDLLPGMNFNWHCLINNNITKHSNCSTGFDSHSEFSFIYGPREKMSLFLELIWAHLCILIKNKDFLILGERPTQKLRDTILTAEAKYPINLAQLGKRFVLHYNGVHYNGSNSLLFVNATKIYQFKANDSELKDYALCLGNISKDFTVNNTKKSGFKGTVKVFLFIIMLLILKSFWIYIDIWLKKRHIKQCLG